MAYLSFLQGKRLFIKDIAHYLVPPNGAPSSIAPSLSRKERGIGTGESRIYHSDDVPYHYAIDAVTENPTVIPEAILTGFHFTFLIRHPRYSIPSYFRCTVPPLDVLTGFYEFMPSEAGYDELRRVFDYLCSINNVGPKVATQGSKTAVLNVDKAVKGSLAQTGMCVVDADDLLDDPKAIIEAYCKTVGLDYDDKMLNWDSEDDHQHARDAFEKWRGFHEDAMNSCGLRPRMHVSNISIFSNDIKLASHSPYFIETLLTILTRMRKEEAAKDN